MNLNPKCEPLLFPQPPPHSLVWAVSKVSTMPQLKCCLLFWWIQDFWLNPCPRQMLPCCISFKWGALVKCWQLVSFHTQFDKETTTAMFPILPAWQATASAEALSMISWGSYYSILKITCNKEITKPHRLAEAWNQSSKFREQCKNIVRLERLQDVVVWNSKIYYTSRERNSSQPHSHISALEGNSPECPALCGAASREGGCMSKQPHVTTRAWQSVSSNSSPALLLWKWKCWLQTHIRNHSEQPQPVQHQSLSWSWWFFASPCVCGHSPKAMSSLGAQHSTEQQQHWDGVQSTHRSGEPTPTTKRRIAELLCHPAGSSDPAHLAGSQGKQHTALLSRQGAKLCPGAICTFICNAPFKGRGKWIFQPTKHIWVLARREW